MDTPTTKPAPQPQIREEDECPICHCELPPKGPDGSEVAREAHVSSCIETHFSSSGPSSAHPPPLAATDAAVAASAATPAQVSGARPIPTGHRESVGSTDSPSASFQQRHRTAGMLVYHANEKDCVGEDGEGAQECIICFVEYAVGDEMGRLECLCKFHKVCPAPSSIYLKDEGLMVVLVMHTAVVGYERPWFLPRTSGGYVSLIALVRSWESIRGGHGIGRFVLELGKYEEKRTWP